MMASWRASIHPCAYIRQVGKHGWFWTRSTRFWVLFFARTYLDQAEGYTHGINLYTSRSSMRRVSLHLCCHVLPKLCPYTTSGVAWTMAQRPAVSRRIHVISNPTRLENHVGNSHSRKSGSLSSLGTSPYHQNFPGSPSSFLVYTEISTHPACAIACSCMHEACTCKTGSRFYSSLRSILLFVNINVSRY
jgi:hypothetical protein